MKIARKIRMTVVATFVATTYLAAQQTASFKFQPEHPQTGQRIDIQYVPSETNLKGKSNISAIAYFFQNYRWRAEDVVLQKDKDQLKATLQIPKNCGLIALKFMADTLVDNNNNMSYAIMLIDSLNRHAAGAYAGWGLMRSPNYGYTIPGYLDLAKGGIKDTVTYYWLNQEINYCQVSQVPMSYLYEMAMFNAQIGGREAKAEKAIAFLKNNNSEQALINLSNIYRNVLNKPASADSVDNVMKERYPKGLIACRSTYRTINAEKDINKRLDLYIKFLQDFPEDKSCESLYAQNYISYDAIRQGIILMAAYNNDEKLINKYVDQLNFNGAINIYYKLVDIWHHRKEKTDAELYPLAKKLVAIMEDQMGFISTENSYLSPSEARKRNEESFARSTLLTHVNLLLNVGQKQDALHYAEKAESYLKYSVADLNADYITLLLDKGDSVRAREVLLKSAAINQLTVSMLDMLRSDYVKQHKSDEGFDAYLQSLRNPEVNKQADKGAEGSIVKGKMPEWSMTDADGKIIKSSDLKGKTYVLDFWATWCVPCKASFPGMKLAVEKYKSDTTVRFFFVDTEEQSATFKDQVRKYIKDNNYPFHILFDNKATGAKSNDEVFSVICKQFTISGIPQKIFVDKNGNVCFISIGYKGSATQLADDISEMVERTKNRK
jgi:thiol-disulfide isomerase/thioredoxin